MPMAEITDGALHYGIEGHGPALVLLLPQSRGPVGLAPLRDKLAARHAVITYDQRGTGLSSPAPPLHTMAQQADDVIALLDAIEIERAALLCHSTGCGIGVAAAAADPGRITAMVLAAPWTYGDGHLTTMQNLRMTLARALDPKPYQEFNAALLYPPDYRRTHAAGFAAMADNAPSRPHDAVDIARRLSAILDFDARPLLPRIAAATLLLTARDDQLMPSWFADEAAAAIAQSQLVHLDGGGHMLLETRTDDVAEAVLDFLARQLDEDDSV